MSASKPEPTSRPDSLGAAVIGVWAVVLALGAGAGYGKLAGIGMLAGLAMMAGAAVATRRSRSGLRLIWADGLAAGALLASAAVFLVPMAMQQHPLTAGLGLGGGLSTGLALRLLALAAGPRRVAFEPSLAALCLHAISAGLAIGVVYTRMPALGLILGVAIISHKLPAGYALARKLQRRGRSRWAVVWPACALGLTCLPTTMLIRPNGLGHSAIVLGFATGLFIYVALDFAIPGSRHNNNHDRWHWGMAILVGAILIAALRGWLGTG